MVVGQRLAELCGDLPTCSYEQIVKPLLEVLRAEPVIEKAESGARLHIRASIIAKKTMEQMSDSEQMVIVSDPDGSKCASANLKDARRFSQLHSQVARLIREQIDGLDFNLEELLVDVDTLIKFPPFSSSKTLNNENWSRSIRLQEVDSVNAKKSQFYHLLETISVGNLDEFWERLEGALQSRMDRIDYLGEDTKEAIEDILLDLKNDERAKTIVKAIDEETIPRIYQWSIPKIYEAILEDLPDRLKNHPGYAIAAEQKQRFEAVFGWLNQSQEFVDRFVEYKSKTTDNPDEVENELNNVILGSAYFVTIDTEEFKETFDVRDILSDANSHSVLPIAILPKSDALSVGNSADGSQRQVALTVAFKLNGKVEKAGVSSFEYQTRRIDPDCLENKENSYRSLKNKYDRVPKIFWKRVLQTLIWYAALYIRVEAKEDIGCRTIESLVTLLDWFSKPQKRSLESKLKLFFEKLQSPDIQRQNNQLKEFFKDILKLRPIKPNNPKTYITKLGLNQSILLEDSEIRANGSFFVELERSFGGKNVLRHLSFDAEPDRTLVEFDIKIELSGIEMSGGANNTVTAEIEPEWFDWALPIILYPRDDKGIKDRISKSFKNRKGIFIGIDDLSKQDGWQRFVSELIVGLLVLTTLKVLPDKLLETSSKVAGSEDIFMPIIRILKNNEDPESNYISKLGYLLPALLSREGVNCWTQGIQWDKEDKGGFRATNAAMSLFSHLPKKIGFATQQAFPIKKFAIVVLSSRTSDSSWGDDSQLATLFGEITRFDVMESDRGIRISRPEYFMQKCHKSGDIAGYSLYNSPRELIERITELDSQNYKHIALVARVPYSQVLNLTSRTALDSQQDIEQEFYLSSDTLQKILSDLPTVNLYPVSLGSYPVSKLGNIDKNTTSYWIWRQGVLGKVIPTTQRSSPFLSVINAKAVRGEGDFVYHHATCYMTPINLYATRYDMEGKGASLDKIINEGLIQDEINNKPNLTKQALLKFMCFVHYSRYAKYGKQVEIKRNPFEYLLDELGQRGTDFYQPSTHRKTAGKFSLLAYLNEVMGVIRTVNDEIS